MTIPPTRVAPATPRPRPFPRPLARSLAMLVLAAVATGCTPSQSDTRPNLSADEQRIRLARELNEKGLKEKDPGAAMALFAKAAETDPFNGPAHNNLGVAALSKGDLYAAATAFDRASKLMPGNPSPRVNLGLVYERAGQLRNAQEQFEQALAITPNHQDAVQALARVRVRAGRFDAVTADLLRKIVVTAGDPAWREWAQKQLTGERFAQDPATEPAPP